ncbi:hypothetical protein [Aestuariivivens marinum]|uniref:hypothetical protein n=1 Tax=Aestuariivivens marinum TaxID=2913555 RepID=UPI001F59CE4C|nr:hypothetical protein [Aestuariivivens marinum]
MKTPSVFKIGLRFLFILLICQTPLNTHANIISHESFQTNDVIITIDNKTSDNDLEDIEAMLKEHYIKVTFSKITRNINAELIGIKITLKDGNGSQTISEFSGSQPISKLTFGIKDGVLFISQGDKPNNTMSAYNFPNIVMGFPSDSIFGQNLRSFNFQDFFGNSNDSLFLNEYTDIQKLIEQMRQGLGQDLSKQSAKYKFIDNPNLDKLIIIDGKESDFETLNKLAELDKLADVETLGPKIAISIYGDKAKDGAIVVVTKN